MFVPFDSLPILPPPTPPTSGEHKYDLFSYEFVCLFVLEL